MIMCATNVSNSPELKQIDLVFHKRKSRSQDRGLSQKKGLALNMEAFVSKKKAKPQQAAQQPDQIKAICEQMINLKIDSNSQQVVEFLKQLPEIYEGVYDLISLTKRLNQIQHGASQMRGKQRVRPDFDLKLLGECAIIKCCKCQLKLQFLKVNPQSEVYKLVKIIG